MYHRKTEFVYPIYFPEMFDLLKNPSWKCDHTVLAELQKVHLPGQPRVMITFDAGRFLYEVADGKYCPCQLNGMRALDIHRGSFLSAEPFLEQNCCMNSYKKFP